MQETLLLPGDWAESVKRATRLAEEDWDRNKAGYSPSHFPAEPQDFWPPAVNMSDKGLNRKETEKKTGRQTEQTKNHPTPNKPPIKKTPTNLTKQTKPADF